MSIDMSAEEVGQLVQLISSERLKKLVDLTGSETQAIELHQAVLGVGCQLMKVIATVEIALRNAVVGNLTAHFGVSNWLQQPPISFQWRQMERDNIRKAVDSAKRAKYAKMTQAEKAALETLAYPNGRPATVSHAQRAKARRSHIPVSEGKVIAELTLHFWKRLYGPDYEQSLWRPTLKRTFPQKTLARAQIASNLEIIYQARNRLAHHEPVLADRFDQALKSVEFIIERIGTETIGPQTPLAVLLNPDIDQARKASADLSARLAEFDNRPAA